MREPAPVMADRDERPPTEDLGARRRRTLLLAWLHVALALGFLAWFVWAQVHR